MTFKQTKIKSINSLSIGNHLNESGQTYHIHMQNPYWYSYVCNNSSILRRFKDQSHDSCSSMVDETAHRDCIFAVLHTNAMNEYHIRMEHYIRTDNLIQNSWKNTKNKTNKHMRSFFTQSLY